MPEPKPAGELKPFTPTPKPVGELRPFNASSKTDEKYYKALSSNLSGDAAKPKDESQFIDKLEFDVADPNNEGKKSILKELAQRGASQEIINNSILTLQGKHPKQQGGFKYYIDEFGIPNPISNNERPPEGYDIASVWGTKKQAQDDNFITNLTKHVWNGIIGTSKGAVALGDMAQGLITGSPSEKAQGLQNSAEYLKFETKDFNPVYTGKEYWDLLKPEKYSFNAENITGNIMQGMESVITFALGAKGVGTVMKGGKAVSAGAKGVSEAAQLTSAQQIAANATSAYNMALSESIDDAKDAGLQGRNIYSFAAVSAIPQAALEVAFGPEAMLLKNQFAQAAKSEFKDAVKQAAKKIERDINGNITKESLDLLSKEMAQEATKLSLKYRAKEVAKNVVGESATEGIQQFADESSKQLYDKLSSDPKFNADAFSPEAVNKIVNATIAGALGSFGPSTAISMSKNKTEFEDKKSKQVFNTVLAGDDSIKAFKKNVYKEQQEGNISPEEANDAIIRLNSYKEYNDITTSSKLNIDTEKKREVFDKTFQKQNLESEIANFGDPAKLHPLKLAEHNSLVKQSNDLQKEIDAIILESSIKKSPTVANKTIADVKKQEEKRTEVSNETNPDLLTQIKNKFKKPSEINRKFEDFPVQEYNTTKNHKLKHEITSEWLSRKNKEDIKYKGFKIKAYDKAYGNVTSRKFSRKNENNSVLGIELPDGKKLRFASSMLRMYPDTEQSGGFRGNFRQERFNTEFPEGTPIGIRVYEVEDNDGDTSKHIKAFRKDNGKFIGWMKSTNRGTFTPDVTQKEQLDHIETIKEVDDGHEIEFNEPVNKPVKQLKVYEGSISKPEDLPIKSEMPTLADDGKVNTTNRKEPATGDNNQVSSEAKGKLQETERTEVKLRTGTKKSNRAIKHPEQRFALDREVFAPYDLALQYFINKGDIDSKDLQKFFNGDKTEFNSRIQLVKKGTLNRREIAHRLWENNSELNFDVIDYLNAVEDVLREFTSRTQMARSINSRYANVERTDFSPQEQELSEALDPIVNDTELNYVESVIEEAETETDEVITQIVEDENGFLQWVESKGITLNEGLEDQFQKSAEIEYAEKELENAEAKLRKAKKELESKRKELDKGLIQDQEDLFGERKSDSPDLLFNERATLDARNEAIEPLKAVYDKAVNDYKAASEKLNKAISKPESQTSLFDQKRSLTKNDVLGKITEVIKTNFPKVKVVYDKTISYKGKPVAGKLKGDTLSINPFYAGNDTPIHEAAHIMLDAMGEIPAVKLAVKQLKDTPLWKEIEQRYPELSGKALENEVLAEAIGREGANIFETEYEKNKFLQYLQYIFDWLKRNLGIEKNVAQNLARQIIYGINTRKKVARTIKYQKEFSDFKEGSGRSTETESDLENIEALLKDKELSKEDRLYLKDVRAQLLDKLAEDKAAFRKYKKSKKQLKTLSNLEQYSLEELTELYKTAKLSGKKEFEEAKNNIAQYLNKKQLETLRENDKFIEDNVDSEDMSWAFLWTGALSEVSEKFPIIQALNNTFRERSLNQIEEANSLKRKHEKLGKAVIKEKNGKLGLVTDLFSSDSAKYFEYLDEDGHLRTNTDNLTKAQIEYLEFVRELTKDKIPDEVTESQLLKIDPGFREVYRNEGLMPAINSYINKTATDKDVTFYNPETKKEETASYLTAQKKLVDYAKKNPVKGIYHLIKLSKQAKPEKSNHYIKKNGQLTSRFDQPRPKDKGYSKDFYKAVNSYIEDKMHIKYMADVVPIVDSVESFYKNLGFEKEKDYKNTLKFLEEWKARQLYQESIKETDPTVDKALSVLRHFTSLTVMGFNVPANIINLAIGNYNTIREDGFKHLAKGQARLFLGKNRAGYGAVNKYALDILKKFNVVNIDSDSNPRATAGKLLSQLAFIGMKTGEINIQGSEFLGHLTDAEYDSFEYDEDGELQIKESLTDKEKADLKQKINEYKTKVSNVQGKYSDKDARNFMRFEAGRSAAQFKLWMFDWFRTRFGKEIINSYGESERGSLSKAAIREFKDQLFSGKFKDVIKNEDFRKNLYGAIVIGTLLAATHGDDDDNEIRKKVISLNKALEQILFIYDIDQAKYLLSSPAASIMTIVNFLDALKAVWDEDEKKFKKSGKKLVPYNKASNLIPS